MKYKVDVYCLCWNEIKILPFVIDYWKKFARHVYVYDNGSDDGSIELLSQYDWITIRHFDSDGFNDAFNITIKNNCWKGSDADWVIVCDLDECVYTKDWDVALTLLDMKNLVIVAPKWLELGAYELPEYQEGKLLHQLVDGAYDMASDENSKHLYKFVMFKPSQVEKTNYFVGAHTCNPIIEGNKGLLGDTIYILHCKQIGNEYFIQRTKQLKERLSKWNVKHGCGTHYSITEEHCVELIKALHNHPKVEID